MNGQDRTCASAEVLNYQLEHLPEMVAQRQLIEKQTAEFINKAQADNRGIITIPVVFHIVWRSFNAVENIKDEQIISQVESLNKDFSKLNTDITKVPAAFRSLVADIGIKFELAKRTPWGAPSNGINHYQSSRTALWAPNDDIKNSSKGGIMAWDSKKYLNVWVCALDANVLGYTQFPGGPVATDGIVLDYKTVGLGGSALPPYNKGRTLTHEAGHWFNLYHLWGNGTCGEDMVSDTPKQTEASYGCPKFPQLNNCIGTNNAKMTMNFMDYTNDECMFMFTNGQKLRIQALFAPGGARESLLSSDALTAAKLNAVCEKPVLLPVTELFSGSAMINWTPSLGSTTFNFKYKATTTSSWQQSTASSSSVTLNGLIPNTEYEYQVQAVCYGTPGDFTTSAKFKTPASQSCGTAQAIRFTNLTHKGVQVSWDVVPGATQYRIQLKRQSVTNWTTYTLKASTCFLSVAAATTYQVQVAAICGTSVGTYSRVSTFTTPKTPVICPDNFENTGNNTLTTASVVNVNTAINATIASSTDVDWYTFSNSALLPFIQVSLTNLTVNYGLKLYSEAGILLATSDNINNSSEIIRYNTGIIGKYYIQVFNVNGSNDNFNCYSLIANTRNTSYGDGSKIAGGNNDPIIVFNEENEDKILRWDLGNGVNDSIEILEEDSSVMPSYEFSVFPNPLTENASVKIIKFSDRETNFEIEVIDVMGRVVFQTNLIAFSQIEVQPLNLSNFENGMYIIKVSSDNQQMAQRIILYR
ncbi:MAG: M43 family zinc metalloprotease [Saprospiraceae bacterium]